MLGRGEKMDQKREGENKRNGSDKRADEEGQEGKDKQH